MEKKTTISRRKTKLSNARKWKCIEYTQMKGIDKIGMDTNPEEIIINKWLKSDPPPRFSRRSKVFVIPCSNSYYASNGRSSPITLFRKIKKPKMETLSRRLKLLQNLYMYVHDIINCYLEE